VLELRTIHCQGSPRELGRAHGEALRPEIASFVAQRLDAFRAYAAERGTSVGLEQFLDRGRRCFAVAAAWDPEGADEVSGIAEGASVDASELYAVTNMTDVRDVLLLGASGGDEGCTALFAPPAGSRAELVAAQTWDLNPADLEYVIAIHRKPSAGPETWSITCAGSLSLMGMNEHGLAVGTTNIKTRSARAGAGYLSLLHRAIRARSAAEAAALIKAAPRAAAHTYWMADGASGTELECDAADVVERPMNRAFARTNHCLSPSLRAREGEPPTASSQKRLARAEQLLLESCSDVETFKKLLADRAHGVDSINRYAEDAQGTTTNACMIAVPGRRELWACRGPADRGRWLKLAFGA
jgi:isopenicillin-N N-acyltransferase-like protein